MPYARIKPHNPRKGLKKKTHVGHGAKFEVGNWYEVDESMAAYLRTVRNDQENDESPLAFEVVDTKEAAKRVVDAERLAANPQAGWEAPIRATRVAGDAKSTLTTADLPGAQDTAAEAEQEGDEGDLESEDLAADVAKDAKRIPGAPKSKARGRKPEGAAS